MQKLTVLIVLVVSVATRVFGQVADVSLQLNLPEGWKAVQIPNGASLVPANAQMTSEAYALMVSPAPAGVSTAEPTVARAMVQQVATQFAGFQLSGEPQMCDVAGERGLFMALSSTDPATGASTLMRVWLTIGGGRMLMISAAGEPNLVASRDREMMQIAANVRCEFAAQPQPMQAQKNTPMQQQMNPNIDPALVGVWQKSNSGAYNSGRGEGAFSMSTASTTTMYLYGNGQGVCNVRSQMAGGTTDVSYQGSGGGNNYPIVWAARNGVFDIRMRDGNGGPSRYQLSRDTLIMYGPKGEQTVYRRVG